jgi:hypothetical protein
VHVAGDGVDFEPFELPEGLADTYPEPDNDASVARAASAVVDLLATCYHGLRVRPDDTVGKQLLASASPPRRADPSLLSHDRCRTIVEVSNTAGR